MTQASFVQPLIIFSPAPLVQIASIAAESSLPTAFFACRIENRFLKKLCKTVPNMLMCYCLFNELTLKTIPVQT